MRQVQSRINYHGAGCTEEQCDEQGASPHGRSAGSNDRRGTRWESALPEKERHDGGKRTKRNVENAIPIPPPLCTYTSSSFSIVHFSTCIVHGLFPVPLPVLPFAPPLSRVSFRAAHHRNCSHIISLRFCSANFSYQPPPPVLQILIHRALPQRDSSALVAGVQSLRDIQKIATTLLSKVCLLVRARPFNPETLIATAFCAIPVPYL